MPSVFASSPRYASQQNEKRSRSSQPVTVIPAPLRTSLAEKKHSSDHARPLDHPQTPGSLPPSLTTALPGKHANCSSIPAPKSDGKETPADSLEWIPAVTNEKAELALPSDRGLGSGYMEPHRTPVTLSLDNYADEEARPESFSDDGDREALNRVWRVLGYLAVMNPFISLFNALFTAAVLIICLTGYPIRVLTTPSSSLSECLVRRLAPQFLLHFGVVFPRIPAHPSAENFHPTKLVLLHLLSPFIAVPFSLAAATVSVMWVYTEVVLGERVEQQHIEYRAYLFVREPWEQYILLALKSKETQ